MSKAPEEGIISDPLIEHTCHLFLLLHETSLTLAKSRETLAQSRALIAALMGFLLGARRHGLSSLV